MITLHAVEERKKIGSCIARVDYYIYILGRYIIYTSDGIQQMF